MDEIFEWPLGECPELPPAAIGQLMQRLRRQVSRLIPLSELRVPWWLAPGTGATSSS